MPNAMSFEMSAVSLIARRNTRNSLNTTSDIEHGPGSSEVLSQAPDGNPGPSNHGQATAPDTGHSGVISKPGADDFEFGDTNRYLGQNNLGIKSVGPIWGGHRCGASVPRNLLLLPALGRYLSPPIPAVRRRHLGHAGPRETGVCRRFLGMVFLCCSGLGIPAGWE